MWIWGLCWVIYISFLTHRHTKIKHTINSICNIRFSCLENRDFIICILSCTASGIWWVVLGMCWAVSIRKPISSLNRCWYIFLVEKEIQKPAFKHWCAIKNSSFFPLSIPPFFSLWVLSSCSQNCFSTKWNGWRYWWGMLAESIYPC